MTSWQTGRAHRTLAMVLALALALGGAAFTLWLGVAGSSAFADLAGRNGLQFSPMSGLLLGIASLLLLLARQQEAKAHGTAPILKLFAIAVALTGAALFAAPLLVD